MFEGGAVVSSTAPVAVRWGSLWRARRPNTPLVDRRNRSNDDGDDDGDNETSIRQDIYNIRGIRQVG